MATYEDVARASLAALDTDAGLVRAAAWAYERYTELATRTRLRHLQRTGELVIPAPLTTGQATVTPGSPLIVGDATASPTWNTNLIGRHFRAQVSWYEILDVVPDAAAAQLILRSAYSETSSGATGYRIVQRFTTLDSNVRTLGKFVHMRRRRELRPLNRLEMEVLYPGRTQISSGPRVVADIGVDPETHERRVEMYPYNTLAEQVVYQYWIAPPKVPVPALLDLSLPNEIDLPLLKTGVLVDLYRYEMAKLLHAGQVEPAALMRNEMRAQITTWERAIEDLISSDRGSNDVSMVLRLHGPTPMDDPLIKDAHDEVLARWPI
jgi:hypothetical protein